MAANGKNQQCKSPAGQRRICVYYHEETGRCTVHASSLWQEAISKRKGKKDDRSQLVLGTHGRIRTCDTWLRRPVLYPLSYVGMREETFGILYLLTFCRPPGTLGPVTAATEVRAAFVRIRHHQVVKVIRHHTLWKQPCGFLLYEPGIMP